MLTEIPGELLEFLAKYEIFYVLGHEEPDGDCLGSQKAAATLLSRMGKRAVLCSPGPFIRPEIKEIEHLFASSFDSAEEAGKGSAAVLVLDCSTPERIGAKFAAEIEDYPVAVIDHHASGEAFGDVRFVNGESPSTTMLVYQLYREIGIVPTAEDAEDMLFGFLTDTGYFRHLDQSNSDSMKLVAELLEYGASLKDLYFRMYGGRNLDSRILTGKVLSRAQKLFGGKCILIYETLEEKKTYGPENRDSDTIYSQLLSVRDCEAVIFIREESAGHCSVSLRSRSDLDVGSIAKSFDGGGHRRAAGFEWRGSRDEIEKKLTSAFGEIFRVS